MKPIPISQFSAGPGVRALNPSLFPEDAPIVDACAPTPKKPSKALYRAEKEFQDYSENWLYQRGYVRLTGANVVEKLEETTRGWFFHLKATSKAEAQRHPLLPDLVIFDEFMLHCLMLELKIRSEYQPGQKELIDSCRWIECREFSDVETAVLEWEKDVETAVIEWEKVDARTISGKTH